MDFRFQTGQMYKFFSGVDMDKDIKTIPVPYGGLVLFHNLTPHRRYEKFSPATKSKPPVL